MPVQTPFLESSKSVVKSFLSSVVLVDDQAYLVAPVEDALPTKLVNPGKTGASRTEEPTVSALQTLVQTTDPVPDARIDPKTAVADTQDNHQEAPQTESSSKRDHTLDGKAVIDIFAQVGVVCAVLRPTKDELPGLKDLVTNLSANVDVVILDWVLFDSPAGERTLDLIEGMVTSSANQSGRAQLIVVYTAEPNLVEIERGIRKRLQLQETPTETLTILSGGTRICIYGKAGIRPTRIGDDRLKNPSELAEVVISEFTEMTKGLLSNVAMKCITAVRAKTFQLLRRFDENVDAPYVTQSTLISPERAEEQLIALIVSEIQEILEDENVGSVADYSHIVEWLDDRLANGLTLPICNNLTSEQYYAGLIQLLRDGVGKKAIAKLKADHPDFTGKIIPGKEKDPAMYVREALTGILRSNPPTIHEADELLTMLMSLRHRYTSPAPQLALGTIVSLADEGGPAYLLCLQPVCDSVRLKEARPFAFLSLKTADSSKNCELIVRDGEQLKFLTLKINPYMLKMIDFNPTQNEKVVADNQNGDFHFRSADNIAFKWIADLKPAHAQRIANNFAYTFSRVGLVESEWNRLGSKF